MERAMAVMMGEDPPAGVALLSSAMAPRPAGGTTQEAHTATTDDERAPRMTTYTERATAHLTRESRQKVRRYHGYYDCTFVALVGTLTGGLCEEARRCFLQMTRKAIDADRIFTKIGCQNSGRGISGCGTASWQ